MNDLRLFLHTSNRMEDLAAMLGDVMRQGRGKDPFRPETVLVQSRGIGRWLSLQLADARSVCLNVRFPFPREVIDEILAVLAPAWKTSAGFGKETMVWKIFRLLKTLGEDPRFAPISHYLEGGDPLKRIQLAERLAHLFDQYLVYRPDFLIDWERRDRPVDWQGVLWQRLVKEAPGEIHLGQVWDLLGKEKTGVNGRAKELPARLCVFGISSLPPLFLRILQAYAAFGELHLFLLQPTDLYWGDLLSKKKQARLTSGKGGGGPAHLEEGHPLVASLGRQGQDLLNLLIDHEFQQTDAGERFVDPGEDSLLHQLQRDVLRLNTREGPDRIAVDAWDQSIQVHACHSPMREVEVLHDQLLDRFAKDSTLRPRDVLVMIPDIELYAPYIEAVFGGVESPRSRIPYSVVDRRPRSTHHAIDVWFRLLDLAGGRFGVREVMALLESGPFQKRFGLTDREAGLLREWIQTTGIRWGIDAAHREEHGLPGFKEASWEGGIEQWLSGYAMRDRADDDAGLFRDLFPFDEVEGSNVKLLNLYLGALDFLFEARTKMSGERPLLAWCSLLGDVLERLFGGVEEIAYETEKIRQALDNLRDNADLARVDEDLPLEVVRSCLEKTIEDAVSSGGFLSGGVTFCTLQPMRTIPARVVCLLGMDDTAFPRRPQQLGFDRMREERRMGDRSVREDDRYLFLETLLSAREHLLISYVGQSARDLTESPPSVLVSELLDHLGRTCTFPEDREAADFLVCRHRLQPFHPDYFTGGRLFSYSAENARACQKLMGETAPPPAFIDGALPEAEETFRAVDVRQLVRFFRNPAEYLLKERLGLRFPQEEAMLEDAEIFSMNHLDRYVLKKETVEEVIGQANPGEWQRAQALGKAPLGAVGLATCHAIEKEAKDFAARVATVIGDGTGGENRSIDRRFNGFHLRGELGPFFGNRLVVYRPARLKPHDCLAAWVFHLFASWSAEEACETILIAEDRTVSLPPRDDAEECIGELLAWYWSGLREPLPFFPASAYAYQRALAGKKPENALAEAEKTFAGDRHAIIASAEAENIYVRLCWGGERMREALDEQFQEMARSLFREISRFEEGDAHG